MEKNRFISLAYLLACFMIFLTACSRVETFAYTFCVSCFFLALNRAQTSYAK